MATLPGTTVVRVRMCVVFIKDKIRYYIHIHTSTLHPGAALLTKVSSNRLRTHPTPPLRHPHINLPMTRRTPHINLLPLHRIQRHITKRVPLFAATGLYCTEGVAVAAPVGGGGSGEVGGEWRGDFGDAAVAAVYAANQDAPAVDAHCCLCFGNIMISGATQII